MEENKKKYYPLRDEDNPNHVTLVEISDDQYSKINRDIWRTRKRMQGLGQCVCPKNMLWACDAHCFECEFQTSGNQISLDSPIEGSDGLTIVDTINGPSLSPESIVMDIAELEALYRELDLLDPEGRLMCQLCMAGLSERRAAEKMGMSRSTYKRHWNEVKARLFEALKDWRE